MASANNRGTKGTPDYIWHYITKLQILSEMRVKFTVGLVCYDSDKFVG